MKQEARVLDVTSTLQGEHIEMTIDPGAMRHIMSVMTDLYSDPELAVIREYSTNAWDSHIEAGQKRPIEVVLPTPLAPFLKIRDFGVGLDVEDIRNTYSRYGASTKRASNDVVGMLGLGCKSALTYSDQFTVTGIKNGIMAQMSISRDADGGGGFTVVDQRPTDEPNGVEILIPAKRVNSFEEKARNFFQYWSNGSVLVNGAEPKRIDGVWITDDLLLTTEIPNSVVVMGNVPYPMLSEPISDGYYNRGLAKVVAFVNIGDVLFTPSRESLQTTAKTTATLNRIRDRVQKEKNPAFERLILAAKTRQEAFKVYLDVKKVGYDGKPSWGGKAIPLKWECVSRKTGQKDWRGNDEIEYDHFILTAGKRYRGQRYRSEKRTDISNTLGTETFRWVKNFDGAEMTAYKRAKLDQYCERNKISHPNEYILTKTLPADLLDWVDAKDIIDWVEVNKEKIVREKVQRRDGRPSGSYSGYVNGIHEKAILAENIDTSAPIFYEQGSCHWGYVQETRATEAARLVKPGTVIVLGQNRVAKFKRDFPTAEYADTGLRRLAKEWSDKLTEIEKQQLWMHVHSDTKSALLRLVSMVNQLDDPDLVKAINLANNRPPATLCNTWDRWTHWGATNDYKFDNPLKHYSLLNHLSTCARLSADDQKQVLIYLNAAYAARKEA